MNKLQKIINNIPKGYFSLNDLEKIVDMDKNSLKVSVSRAIKSGKIKKLTKGLYTNNIDNLAWENLAINIYAPSYISFESALSYYNILSQQTIGITLATARRRKELNMHDQVITYRHIKSELFWGYKKERDFLIAEPEKAFLDLAYLSLNGYGHFDPKEMNIETLNKQKIKKYLNRFNNKRLKKLINLELTA